MNYLWGDTVTANIFLHLTVRAIFFEFCSKFRLVNKIYKITMAKTSKPTTTTDIDNATHQRISWQHQKIVVCKTNEKKWNDVGMKWNEIDSGDEMKRKSSPALWWSIQSNAIMLTRLLNRHNRVYLMCARVFLLFCFVSFFLFFNETKMNKLFISVHKWRKQKGFIKQVKIITAFILRSKK